MLGSDSVVEEREEEGLAIGPERAGAFVKHSWGPLFHPQHPAYNEVRGREREREIQEIRVQTSALS